MAFAALPGFGIELHGRFVPMRLVRMTKQKSMGTQGRAGDCRHVCLRFRAAGATASGCADDRPTAQPVPAAITLDEAIARARANEPMFAAAVASAKNAKLDQSIARAALLPNVAAENQFLYTQGGAGIITNPVKAQQPDLQATSAPRFIANNAVHEYSNQAVVTETIGPARAECRQQGVCIAGCGQCGA